MAEWVRIRGSETFSSSCLTVLLYNSRRLFLAHLSKRERDHFLQPGLFSLFEIWARLKALLFLWEVTLL
jgi:hypothetical protein